MHSSLHGRGTKTQPANRFDRLSVTLDDEELASQGPRKTQFYQDKTSSIITYNKSPDITFGAGLNPYRGCEHGCSYCYARPYHEYLGFSSGLDFETRIVVKSDAPKLLRAELSSSSWKPQILEMSGVTDCYQPVERKLELTRGCLKVLADFRNPVGIITKNHLVVRDIDCLAELAKWQAVRVHISITTLDAELSSSLEPRASLPNFRLDAVRQLALAGIPVGVSIAPIIPGLNEHEIPAIMQAAKTAGATFATYAILRLPHAVKGIFRTWLEDHKPLGADTVLNRVRELRSGKLNSSEFGERFRGTGPLARNIEQLFNVSFRRAGFESRWPDLSIESFRNPYDEQLDLFAKAA